MKAIVLGGKTYHNYYPCYLRSTELKPHPKWEPLYLYAYVVVEINGEEIEVVFEHEQPAPISGGLETILNKESGWKQVIKFLPHSERWRPEMKFATLDVGHPDYDAYNEFWHPEEVRQNKEQSETVYLINQTKFRYWV